MRSPVRLFATEMGGGATLASPRISSARWLAFLPSLPAFAKRMSGTSDQGGCVARDLAKRCIFDRGQRCLRENDGVGGVIEALDHLSEILAGPHAEAVLRQRRHLNPCRSAQRLKPCPRFHPAFPFAINAQLTSQRIISRVGPVIGLGSARALACWRWRPRHREFGSVGAFRRGAEKNTRGACAPQIESHLLAVDARKRIPPKQSAADTAAATD